jgi:hypothetical protein
MEDKAVHDAPWGTPVSHDGVTQLAEVRVLLQLIAEVGVEVERGHREGTNRLLVLQAPRERIRNNVEVPWSKLHCKIETKQLAYPLMLRNSGEPLIQEELQSVVVRVDHEAATLEIRPPVTNCLHQTDQFALISC